MLLATAWHSTSTLLAYPLPHVFFGLAFSEFELGMLEETVVSVMLVAGFLPFDALPFFLSPSLMSGASRIELISFIFLIFSVISTASFFAPTLIVQTLCSACTSRVFHRVSAFRSVWRSTELC